MACDGIWDVSTSEAARDFVTTHLKAGLEPQQICERLLDHCLLHDSKDNMTAVLVLFEGAPKPVPGFQVPAQASVVAQPSGQRLF